MNKLFVFVFMLFVLVPSVAQAQTAELAVISQNSVDEEGEISPRLILEPYLYLTDRFGLWGYAYGEKQYASATAGPYYDFSLGKNGDILLEAGIAAGVETFPDDESGKYKIFSRYAGFVSLDYEKFSLFTYHENGSSHDSWLRIYVDYHVTEKWTIGGIHQTDDGVGPRITFTTQTRTPVRIWVASMFGDEPVILFGIEVLFQKK